MKRTSDVRPLLLRLSADQRGPAPEDRSYPEQARQQRTGRLLAKVSTVAWQLPYSLQETLNFQLQCPAVQYRAGSERGAAQQDGEGREVRK